MTGATYGARNAHSFWITWFHSKRRGGGWWFQSLYICYRNYQSSDYVLVNDWFVCLDEWYLNATDMHTQHITLNTPVGRSGPNISMHMILEEIVQILRHERRWCKACQFCTTLSISTSMHEKTSSMIVMRGVVIWNTFGINFLMCALLRMIWLLLKCEAIKEVSLPRIHLEYCEALMILTVNT